MFATADELIDYMCQPNDKGHILPWDKGYDRETAENWVKNVGWAPSMIGSSRGVEDGVTAMGRKENS